MILIISHGIAMVPGICKAQLSPISGIRVPGLFGLSHTEGIPSASDVGIGSVSFLPVLLKGHGISLIIIVHDRALGFKVPPASLMNIVSQGGFGLRSCSLDYIPSVSGIDIGLICHLRALHAPEIREAHLLLPKLLLLPFCPSSYEPFLMDGIIAFLSCLCRIEGTLRTLSGCSHEAAFRDHDHAYDEDKYENDIGSHHPAERYKGLGYGASHGTSSQGSLRRDSILIKEGKAPFFCKHKVRKPSQYQYVKQGAEKLERSHEVLLVLHIEYCRCDDQYGHYICSRSEKPLLH